MTKPKNSNKLISYGNLFDIKLVYSLAWIYKYYFGESLILFLPKIVNIEETLEKFNLNLGEFSLTLQEVVYCNLETIEFKGKFKVVIYGFADFIFNDLVILNKKRINTHLKNLKNKTHIISNTSLKSLDLPALDTFEYFKMENACTLSKTFNYIDFLEEETIESFVEFIVENRDKRIYLALNISNHKILQIEKALKENGVNVSRTEIESDEPVVIINSLKTIQRSFLKNRYFLYIFITPHFEYPLDLLNYLKEIYLKEIDTDSEVYFDSSRVKNINESLNSIYSEQINERITIKDSQEYTTYIELVKAQAFPELDSMIVSEAYYKFDAPQSVKDFDLKNLTKRQYEIIRTFVKVKLMGKMDLDIKTCQLSSVCSPKDRSKKLNSLSNKISSYDYRCDVTCEIFKDYTIGVVLWNETFANRKTMDLSKLKNQVFIHQTTSGNWKYTTVK